MLKRRDSSRLQPQKRRPEPEEEEEEDEGESDGEEESETQNPLNAIKNRSSWIPSTSTTREKATEPGAKRTKRVSFEKMSPEVYEEEEEEFDEEEEIQLQQESAPHRFVDVPLPAPLRATTKGRSSWGSGGLVSSRGLGRQWQTESRILPLDPSHPPAVSKKSQLEEEQPIIAADGSPAFKAKNLGLTDVAELMLTKWRPKEVCTWVPQTAASIGTCCFFLDLENFPETTAIVAGDLGCDGYEPWGRTATGGWFFLRVGDDFQRINFRDKSPEFDQEWDLVVRERRSRRAYMNSRLLRKLYTVETQTREILRDYGAILVYAWAGPPIDFPISPHGNARRPDKMTRKWVRTAPSTLQRAALKLTDAEAMRLRKAQALEDTNREILESTGDERVSGGQLLRDTKQMYYLSSKRRQENAGLLGPRPKVKEDELLLAIRETLNGRFLKGLWVGNEEGASVNARYHIFCAQQRQLDMLRKFACFRPPETQEEAEGLDLSEKRCLYVDVSSSYTDCFVAVLGMTHPYFESYETGQEAFLPVGYFLTNHREKADYVKCAEMLSSAVDHKDEGLVFFGLATDVEQPLYAGFREKPMFMEPSRHVLNEFRLQEICQNRLKESTPDPKARENILVDVFGSVAKEGECWRYDGCLIDSQSDQELEAKMEALRPDWDAVAPGFYNFFSRKLDLLKACYLLGHRESCNLRESKNRTDSNRLEELEAALKEAASVRKRLSVEETIAQLDKHTDAVYHKLELAVLHGSRMLQGDVLE